MPSPSRGRLAIIALIGLACVRLVAMDPLLEGFRQPPESARPLVFWQWMNGCVTKEGITSDLESFKRVGLGGVQQFLVGGSESVVTDPTVQILNPKWRELMRFSMEEAARLDLSFGTHNCPGWSASGSPGVQPVDAMKKLVWSVTESVGDADVDLTTLPLPDSDRRYYRDVVILAIPASGPVRSGDVQMLPGSRWHSLPGRWKIFRFGETLTGAVNGTAPLSGQGLEVDKLSRAALDRFWPTYPAHLLELAGKFAGTTFTRLELDSYEAGVQEWTTDALAQFSAACGYDARVWLPVFAGETVGSADASQRFKEDWRLMVARSLTANYFGHLGELIRQTPGMQFLLEPYATGKGELFNTSEVAAKGDLLMCEFWTGPTTWGWDSIKPVASAVHTLGRRIVQAEAFTGQPMYAWRVAPYDLKAPGDLAFTKGVNRMVLHAAAQQPWPPLKPGMTMGWWGTQFGPGQTWWEHGGPEWLAYLSRCQFLLQQGNFVGDLAFFSPGRTTPDLPTGYDGDTVGENILLNRLTVRDGRLVLPEGGSYRALILPALPAMRLEVLEKIRELVESGAIIAGPRPGRMLGQRGGANAEARFRELVSGLWDQGRIRAEFTPAQLLASIKVEPDVHLESNAEVHWIHRRTENEDIYFVSNPGVTGKFAFSLRTSAPEVEIWHPDTGSVELATVTSRDEGRTKLSLDLEANGSCFVVFRSKPTAGRREPPPATVARTNVTGPWRVDFPPHLGAPASIILNQLASWTENSEEGVQHFSGTATYSKTILIPPDFVGAGRRVFLDLGNVKHIASVRINGKSFPALWKPPYRLEVTSALRQGENALEIEATNLWPNRLIGDAREPEDAEWGEARQFKYVEPIPTIGRPLLKIPDWVAKGTPRPSSHRVAFTTFDFFKADAPLLESGLLGPVVVELAAPGP
ncbi:MAG TPA: glycosyl hydrolase [Lacunisphaera sp.]